MSSPLVAPAPATMPVVPGLPLLGNLIAFRRDRLGLADQAGQLGPIARVSIGPIPVHFITCADLAREVLVVQAANVKKSAGLQFLKPLLGEGLLTAEAVPHRQHRKLLAPAFAPKRLASYGQIMVEETARQAGRWSPGDRIDIADQMMEMTLAIAGRTLFGVDVRGEASVVARALELAMHSMVDNLTSPVRLGYRWPLPRHLRMKRAVQLLDDVVYRLIAEGRKLGPDGRSPIAGGGDPDGLPGGAGVLPRGNDRGDVLSMLLLARDEDDGTTLSDSQVRDEVMTLLLAGHETTANALTWMHYELGKHPDVLARLEAEIQTVCGDRPITTEDLPALPWTAAVVDEALRLHPPAYMVGREAITELELGGHRLPPKSVVVVNIRAIHRRADYFPAPLAFRPERMLPEAKKARPRHHYLPFGAGPRVCIGSHFALMEAQLCLATMVQHARLRPLKTAVQPEPLVTLRPRGGMPAIVERA